MQGHRATVASLSDLFDLEHGASSSNPTIEWNNLPDHHDSEGLLPPSNGLGLRNDRLFGDQGHHLTNNTIFSIGQSSSSRSTPRNLDISSSFIQVESNSLKPSTSNNQRISSPNSSVPEPSAGISASQLNHGEDGGSGYRGSLDGQCVPCKRKSFEEHVGPSSVVRSSSYDEDAENSIYPDASLNTDSVGSGNSLISEQTEPNLLLGARRTSRSSERLSRSFRSRSLHHSDSTVAPELLRSDFGLLLSRQFPSGDINAQVQSPELNVPAFLLSGPHRASPAGPEISRGIAVSSSRNTLENHPIFAPSTDSRFLGQSMSLSGGSIHIPRNISPLQTGASTTIHPGQLSDYVRMSLFAVDSERGGGQISYSSVASGPSASSQSIILSSTNGNTNNHARHSLPLRPSYRLERQGDEGVLGLPYSLRAFATAGEGRRRFASEIRNFLEMMHRGHGLRVEDFMILDQSILLGVADAHDRHRDMRLDVDNMSYEELLALEERMGNVSTGLSEETILARLKQGKYVIAIDIPWQTEPCCICQEDYNDGENLGILECGHDFHKDCIKQWLMNKNLCPICKTAGLTT
ncbi:hypothetical protein SAY87_031049 [Trapa incisa]|uniref:RING-type E3 ubiquitin transferase n=1 Tax=Trapa incisa TaxID=236973 RepID=A0AAN7KP70_9MYRT|nr:hypothetical protein SAY87_031049 [Trapa incisa]